MKFIQIPAVTDLVTGEMGSVSNLIENWNSNNYNPYGNSMWVTLIVQRFIRVFIILFMMEKI